MNVLFDFTPAEYGGAYTSLLNFIDYVNSSLKTNIIICVNNKVKNKIEPIIKNKNIKIHVSDNSKNGLIGKFRWYNQEIVEVVKKENVKYAFFPLGVISNKLNIPKGTIIRQALPYCKGIRLPLKIKLKMFLLEKEFKKSIINASDVFVQTNFMKKILEERYYKKAKIITWNIIDYEKIKRLKNNIKSMEDNKSYKEIKIFYPAIPVSGDYKNFRNLFLAMKKINSSKYKLLVSFDKDTNKESKKLYKFSHKIGINNNIEFLGLMDREKIYKKYIESDIIIFPSICESFGVPLLEAMAFEKTILASDMLYSHDVCEDAAYYFNPYDSEKIAEAIKFVAENEKIRLYYSEKGIEKYEKKYSTINIWEEIFNIIEEKYNLILY